MRRLPLASRRLRWSAVALAATAIWYASVVVSPGNGPRSVAGPYWDESLHAVAYATLGLLTASATADRRDRPVRRALAVVVGVVGYGVLVEVAQLSVSHRQFSPTDLLANAAGALVVVGWFALEARAGYRRADRREE